MSGLGRERELHRSRKPKSVRPTDEVRAEAYARDQWWCVRCGTGDVALNLHHRTARGMGGTRDPLSASPANLITLCGSGTTGCHGWVESHREVSFKEGWLVPRGIDPATVPVRCGGYWWFLDHDGGRRPVP